MQWISRPSLSLTYFSKPLSNCKVGLVWSLNARHKGSSTPAWLNRQRRDPFVKARGSYRSRSAFKLLQMNEQYQLFPKIPKGVNHATNKPRFFVADLGCSPGGWSQASLELLGARWGDSNEEEELLSDDEDAVAPQIIGVDIIRSEPLPGARFLQGDFLDPSVQRHMHEILGSQDAQLDLIISDMAPNLTGNRIADIEASLELCRAVLEFAKRNLRHAPDKNSTTGTLVMKHFAAPEFDEFRLKELAPLFEKKIVYTKPEASRQKSSEAYFICRRFKG